MSDSLDRLNKNGDYFADMIRKPAKSIQVYNQMKYCERMSQMKMKTLVKEKKMIDDMYKREIKKISNKLNHYKSICQML
ncbi:unnamed protein product [Brachionus calyciflorus]|uniref:Uncharacterized protein n=1 Tax=Brachionus calyciflorus TaxID=104777 RepID=A0A813PCW5_9BILA|nr:unnamed protein product [Brachionus calyciflorus]